MKTFKAFLIAASLTLGLTGSAQAIVSGGETPIPAQWVNGQFQSVWDGSYSDLLAADALATCWMSQKKTPGVTSFEGDQYLQSLMNRMQLATCYTTCNDTSHGTLGWEDIPICLYLQSRQDAGCNMDAATGDNKALKVKLRTQAQTADYALPDATTLALTGSLAGNAILFAQQELSYAELSLCMAEQLNEKLDTAQVAFASNEDLFRVQDAVRERALTAVYEFSVIGKVLANSTAPPTAINHDQWFLPVFSQWRSRVMTAAMATRMGDDFLQSIKLLGDATEAAIRLRLRDPEAQDSFGTPTWAGSQFAGLLGARSDVLEKILYDGYDLTTQTTKRRSVLTDMSEPQVGVLLGLARSANALKLHVNAPPQFTSSANASALLLAVENYVRNADCTNRGIPAGSCVLATGSTAPSAYLLWQRYGIGIGHATALVDALTELMFGPTHPSNRSGGYWNYPPLFGAGTTGPSAPAEQLGAHIFGRHSFTGTISQTNPVGDVLIDSAFTISPPDARDIQSMRNGVFLPVRDPNPAGRAVDQIGWFRFNPLNATDDFGYPADRRQLGSSTVLALAREALLQLSVTSTVAKGIYTQAAPAVTLIEKLIGVRQATLRQTMAQSAATYACTGCFIPVASTSVSAGVTTNNVTVDVLTKSTDPMKSVAIAPGVPLAATLAFDPNTTTVFGNTQANALATMTYTTPTPVSIPAFGYEQRTATGSWLSSSARGVTIMLKTTTGTITYDHVFTGTPGTIATGNPGSTGPFGPFGTVVTFGGRFDRLATDAWAFDKQKWSMPKYDGFGLKRTWAPAADASLFGEAPGVSVERHFLGRASIAANESATALQQAFDSLQQQSIDDAAVAASDARSKSLTDLEFQSLCGSVYPSCSPSYTGQIPVVPLCTGAASPDCETYRASLAKVVGSSFLQLATPVVNEINLGNPAPTFPNYRGGVLQNLFVTEWNNWQGLGASMKSAVATARTAIAQMTAANADWTAAVADYNQVNADITTAYNQVISQIAGFGAQKVMYDSQKTIYDAQLLTAQTTATQECSPVAFQAAWNSGYSASGGDLNCPPVQADAVNTFKWHCGEVGTKTWSPSAVYAQQSRCRAAETGLAQAITTTTAQKDSMNALVQALELQMKALGMSLTALPLRRAAAEAHKESALQRLVASQEGVTSQEAAATQAVQSAFGQVLSSLAAIDVAYTQADVAAARIGVEQQQANYDLRARFGVRARYRSYDLWRARALTENARRLAVAARRSIESRYVVDLSAMNASEPFVDAPALWADKVYAADLKPFTIGLSPGPVGGSGLYANAVGDYVGNLALFLDGFAVQRPSAAVAADGEVIQIPGPAAQVVTSSYGSSVNYIDPTSSGWSFYCPSTDTWIADPDVGRFVTGTATWTLATACGGTAPTLARLGFTLDPWGRYQGATANPPFTSRYNVRMGALAVNLVGSGIRACQSSTDPSTCYSEPFIRYDLKHVGPAWVTDYSQAWKSLEIPKAIVESGKALATEEWLDPVTNGFNRPDVVSVVRRELEGRPIGGAYELTLRLTPDVRVERISRIQVLVQSAYWVRQQ